jgi:hypothetical protein
MVLKRLDNIGIVVDDLELTIDFFQEFGIHLEGCLSSRIIATPW